MAFETLNNDNIKQNEAALAKYWEEIDILKKEHRKQRRMQKLRVL